MSPDTISPGLSIARIMLIPRVVFPLPDSPITPTEYFVSGTAKETSSSAVTL